MITGEKINWIEGTPLGVNIREIEYIAPHVHNDIVEITLCLSGEIKMSYCFEEFTLGPGDFILVDKDTHYLYDGKDAVCASFYIDLKYFEEKYPYINHLYFVCEGTPGSSVPYNTENHKQLKGILLAILLFMLETPEGEAGFNQKITEGCNNVIDIIMNKFDIIFFYEPQLEITEKSLMRCRLIMDYIFRHQQENITVGDLAREFGLSEAYITEFLKKYFLGFRKMVAFTRLCHAETLLLYTDMNILQISEACNFSDPKYLYETFDFWYECTPNQFRKKYSKEMGNESRVKELHIDDVITPVVKMTRKHFMDTFL